MSVIHNERTKLRANALDRLATAFVAIGCVAPWVAVVPEIGGARPIGLALGTLAWLASASMLRISALRILGALRPWHRSKSLRS